MESREERLRRLCREHGQEHLWAYWDRLSAAERDAFLEDVERVPFTELPTLREIVRGRGGATHGFRSIEPPICVRRPEKESDDPRRRRGESLLRDSRVAAFTVAGGQGTRLGFDGPKGAFAISPVRGKPLFQLFAEQIIATDRRYGGATHWYIMTSDANDSETRAFFERQNHFGLAADRVIFFRQGSMPAFSTDGRILLDQPGRLALSPDGHGGSLLALARSGVLAQMAASGIEYVSYFQVDNPMVRCLDPFFLGLHVESRSDMSSKMVPKATDDEKVGLFAQCDGKLQVLEYSDLPAGLASARNSEGSRKFDAGSIAIHVLSRSFIERLTADPARFRLPWHRAMKKVPHVALPAPGQSCEPAWPPQRIEPAAPNAVKLEAFVFDALPLAANPVVLETNRREEFSPVKNATGVDSVATAKRDLSDRAARWLAAAGCNIPRAVPGVSDGEFEGVYEISSLRAMQAEDLRDNRPLPRITDAAVYVE